MQIDIELLKDCITNVESITELDLNHVYLIALKEDLPKQEANQVAKKLLRLLTNSGVKGIIIPSDILGNIYEIIPSDKGNE